MARSIRRRIRRRLGQWFWFYATGWQPTFSPLADGQVATAARDFCLGACCGQWDGDSFFKEYRFPALHHGVVWRRCTGPGCRNHPIQYPARQRHTSTHGRDVFRCFSAGPVVSLRSGAGCCRGGVGYAPRRAMRRNVYGSVRGRRTSQQARSAEIFINFRPVDSVTGSADSRQFRRCSGEAAGKARIPRQEEQLHVRPS